MMTPATAAWLLKGGMLLYSEFQGSAMSNTALLLPNNNPSLSHHQFASTVCCCCLIVATRIFFYMCAKGKGWIMCTQLSLMLTFETPNGKIDIAAAPTP